MTRHGSPAPRGYQAPRAGHSGQCPLTARQPTRFSLGPLRRPQPRTGNAFKAYLGLLAIGVLLLCGAVAHNYFAGLFAHGDVVEIDDPDADLPCYSDSSRRQNAQEAGRARRVPCGIRTERLRLARCHPRGSCQTPPGGQHSRAIVDFEV
jgi:hypothetical protein